MEDYKSGAFLNSGYSKKIDSKLSLQCPEFFFFLMGCANLSSSFYLSLVTSSFFFFLINLFIFDCTGSSLLLTGPPQSQQAGATLRRGVQAPHHGGLSRCGARAPGTRASAVAARGLSSCGPQAPQRRLSRCGARAQLLCGMRDPPRPGPEPASPALAGRLPTTAPPGKPHSVF